jgi:cupin fold WbuC family metalloprotein
MNKVQEQPTVKPIDNQLFDALCDEADEVSRRRTHHLIHPSRQDPVQRMLIALQPGTYFRPHRHLNPPKWELLLVLKGAAAWLGFDDGGHVTARLEAGAHRSIKGLESPEGAWHALVCLAPDTVIFECKPGPFTPVAPEDLASWAPAEGSPEAAAYVRWMLRARIGERCHRPDAG